MQPLRVGLFIQHFPPYLGGAEKQSAILAEELVRLGHRVEIATTRFNRELESTSRAGEMSIRRLPTTSSRWLKLPINLVMGFFAGLRLGRRVDIFHAHCLSPFSLGAVLAAKLLRRPILVKICSVGEDGDVCKVRGFGPGELLWRAFRRCDLFVAGTSSAVEEVIQNGVEPDRVALIPSLLREPCQPTQAQDRCNARRELGLPDRTTLLYLGRLDEGKGLESLMALWPDFSRQYDVQLLLVGEGPQRADIEAWRRRENQEDDVILAGYQSDTGPWYRAADIFVFPSRSESFGNVIVEAMSHGLAVASTRVGVVQDWPQDAPLSVFDASHPTEFAKTLAALVEDESQRLEQGGQAAEFMNGRYGAAAIAEQYQFEYERLLKRGPLDQDS